MSKEFQLTDNEFKRITDLVYQSCGIVLGSHKREMVYSRLARRLRATGIKSFSEYLTYLESHKDEEFSEFINAITTNLTSFFREDHHFQFLKSQAVDDIRKWSGTGRKVRVWSAGCSTGEEPYSIAMTLKEIFPPSTWDFKILATDLDSNVLNKAFNGEYSANNVNGISDALLKKWFLRDRSGETYRAKDELKNLIHFKRLNLLQDWPMKGPFDVIFCRNVVIYFDNETKNQLFKRYHQMLKPNGYLFLGHSETMGKEQTGFKSLGKTMYQKV